jgi:hypothetical protein
MSPSRCFASLFNQWMSRLLFIFSFLGACFCCFGEVCAAIPDRLLISVVSQPCDQQWNARAALLLESTLSGAGAAAMGDDAGQTPQTLAKTVTACAPEALTAELTPAQREKYSYYYQLVREPDGTLQLTLENWSEQSPKEFAVLRWSIGSGAGEPAKETRDPGSPATFSEDDYQDFILHSLLEQSKVRLGNPQAAQPGGVRGGVASANGARSDGAGALTQKDSGPGNNIADQAHGVYSNDGPREKHYLRAALETLGFLGAASAYYWTHDEDFSRDFDYNVDWQNLKERFITGGAHRFDNNEWEVNVGHFYGGTGYYLLARSNNLNLLESMLYTVAASATWEFLIEMREAVAINDNIMTPFAGFAIGEVMYQFGEFFQHSSDNIANQTLGTLLELPAPFHHWLDNTKIQPPRQVDDFGFTTDVWHRFRVFAGGGGSTSQDKEWSRTEAEVGFDLELATAEKYGKPGEASTFYSDGVFQELAFRTILAEGAMVDLQFFAKTDFLGHYQQSIEKDEAADQLNGYSLFVGASSAFEYYAHSFAGIGQEDKQAICDLLGPSLVVDYYHRGLHLHATLDVYPNFAMVQPYAVEEYAADHIIRGVKNVFQAEDYYYALGLTTAARMEAYYGPFELETKLRYYFFDSIEGLNRMPDRVVNDFNMQDQSLWMQAGLIYALPINHLKIAFDVERLYRWSQLSDLDSDQEETRYLGKVIFEF